jgi:hypothetical protein
LRANLGFVQIHEFSAEEFEDIAGEFLIPTITRGGHDFLCG